MSWRSETEDSMGWGFLVPKAERLAEERQAALEKDAHRYRKLRRGNYWLVVDGVGDLLHGDALDAALDATPAVGAA